MSGTSEKDGFLTKEQNLTGEDLQIWGDVRMRKDGVIRVKVRGSVHGSGKIVVEEEGSISGRVEGTDVRVEGEVEGGVIGRGQVWLGKKSVVRVLCAAQGLRVEAGADFQGELKVGG